MSDEPLFSCSRQECAEEVTYTAGEFRMHEGKRICKNCWDHQPLIYLDDTEENCLEWHDLEPFVPEYQKRIDEARAEIAKLKDEIDDLPLGTVIRRLESNGRWVTQIPHPSGRGVCEFYGDTLRLANEAIDAARKGEEK